MRIIVANPPLYEEIDAAFGIGGRPIIFAWGDAIYNPLGGPISDALMAHEAVHGERQLGHPGGPEAWWRRYIAEPAFRLEEEIPAHRAEFAHWGAQSDALKPVKGFRCKRDWHLHVIAARLAGPLYGNLMPLARAKALLLEPA